MSHDIVTHIVTQNPLIVVTHDQNIIESDPTRFEHMEFNNFGSTTSFRG